MTLTFILYVIMVFIIGGNLMQKALLNYNGFRFTKDMIMVACDKEAKFVGKRVDFYKLNRETNVVEVYCTDSSTFSIPFGAIMLYFKDAVCFYVGNKAVNYNDLIQRGINVGITYRKAPDNIILKDASKKVVYDFGNGYNISVKYSAFGDEVN